MVVFAKPVSHLLFFPLFLFLIISLLSFLIRAMVTPAKIGDASWQLTVQVDQKEGVESMKFKMRVAGDLHIGGLMLKLVEKIRKCVKMHVFLCSGSISVKPEILTPRGATAAPLGEAHPCLSCILVHYTAIVLSQ